MFYVEHMKNTTLNLIFLVICLFFVFSCEKRDPNPELSDAIYLDLKNEFDIAQKNLAAELTQNSKTLAELNAVTPQTGQRKYAQKRYFESNNNLELYRQQAKYFEIGLELRKNVARERYTESFKKNGRPWPDQAEADDYKIRLKLQKAKLMWGKKPELAKEVPRGTGEGAAQSAEPSAEPKSH